LIIAFGAVLIIGKKTEINNPGNKEIILFYGEGCPHCANVESYLKENDIESRIKIEKKEVYFNRQNSELLSQKARACGIKTNEIGVPFLWDGSKCIIGEEDIINFFKEKISGK